MEPFYEKTTVKKLREILAKYDDNDVIEIVSHGGEWSIAELHIIQNGSKEDVLMEVDG